jgi:Coenzyme PQQ synthesis protein D (PqqD)
VIAKDVISCELDGETAMLNVRTGIYYGLDEVGASIWRMLSQSCTVGDIVRHITTDYRVDVSRCEADLVILLNELDENGLIEIDNGAVG